MLSKALLRNLVLVLLFLFILGLRIEHRIVFYYLGYDKTRQMAASGNLIRNNGISDCTATADDLELPKSSLYMMEVTPQ